MTMDRQRWGEQWIERCATLDGRTQTMIVAWHKERYLRKNGQHVETAEGLATLRSALAHGEARDYEPLLRTHAPSLQNQDCYDHGRHQTGPTARTCPDRGGRIRRRRRTRRHD
jgi:hypothetical protein